MAQQDINIGAEDAKTGDSLFSAFTKTQANFDELYNAPSGIANRIEVNTFDDFPEPMLADTQYYIGANIIIPNTLPASWLDLPDNIEFKGSVVSSRLTWAGTGTLFNGSDMTRFRVDNVLLDTPNGTIYNIVDTTGSTIVNLFVASVVSCLEFGTLNVFALVIDTINVPDANDGLSVGNKTVVLSVNRATINSTSATFTGIDVTGAAISTLEISNFRSNAPAGGVAIRGDAASANILAGDIGSVTSCEFSGGITDLAGITIDDIRWSFKNNTPTQDTLRDCLIYSSTTSTTTIATAETYVKLNATWATDSLSGFTADSTGKVTWAGERIIKVPVDMSLSIAPVSGTGKTLRTRIGVNGSTLPNSTRTTVTDNGDASSVTTPWQISLNPGDYIEGFITSADGTNIECTGGILRIN